MRSIEGERKCDGGRWGVCTGGRAQVTVTVPALEDKDLVYLLCVINCMLNM